MDIDYSILPKHMQDAMRRYMEDGIPPGSFLEAVLSNDLLGALSRADHVNVSLLYAYGEFLYTEAPILSYGCKDRYKAWIESGGINGLQKGGKKSDEPQTHHIE